MMSIDQLLGLATGVIFGFLLQKGRVLRYEKQVSALLLKDMTIFKFMLSAIVVGMFGILALSDMGLITLNHKAMNIGELVLGGALFGVGWAVMGYCPGTSVGAVGEGRWHAIFGAIGMVVGAGIYAQTYPFFKSTILAWSDLGKIGLPEAIAINHWIVAIVFTLVTLMLFRWFEKKGL
jgi:uncharacterized membrane protein YedE/YeeE